MLIRRKLSTSFIVFALSFCGINSTTKNIAACVDGTTNTDRDIQRQLGCSRPFIDWQFNIYDMRGWDDWGLKDTCNLDLPYAKTVNAAYLISHGLPRSESRGDSLLFHGTIDYESLVSAGGGEFHHSLYYGKADASDDSLASFHRPWFGRNYTELHCPLFDMRQDWHNNPLTRATSFIHEGWHAWQDRYNFNGGDNHGHLNSNTGTCTGKTCDWWYSHSSTDYEFGKMYEYDVNQRPVPKFHSPMQTEVEYACDLAIFANGWVSNGIIEYARAWAAGRTGSMFANQPPVACSAPRMFFPTPGHIEGTISFPNPSDYGQPIVRNGENVCNRITIEVFTNERCLWCLPDQNYTVKAEGNYQNPGDTCRYRIDTITQPIFTMRATYQLIETSTDPSRATWTPQDPSKPPYNLRTGIGNADSGKIQPGETLRKDFELQVFAPVIVR